jgi:hypothetical protein
MPKSDDTDRKISVEERGDAYDLVAEELADLFISQGLHNISIESQVVEKEERCPKDGQRQYVLCWKVTIWINHAHARFSSGIQVLVESLDKAAPAIKRIVYRARESLKQEKPQEPTLWTPGAPDNAD